MTDFETEGDAGGETKSEEVYVVLSETDSTLNSPLLHGNNNSNLNIDTASGGLTSSLNSTPRAGLRQTPPRRNSLLQKNRSTPPTQRHSFRKMSASDLFETRPGMSITSQYNLLTNMYHVHY